MEFMQFVVGTVLNWVALMIVLPIAVRIGGFSFPGLKAAAPKLAVLVLATNVISLTLAPVIGIGAAVINLVVFWTAMVKWFDVDFFGAVVIMVVNLMVSMGLVVVIGALMATAA